MRQERYNLFKRAHKGLSSMVFDAGTRIQQTDFSNPEEGNLTNAFIEQAVQAFKYHINNEDTVIFNAVANTAPFIVAMLEKSNAKDLQLALAITEKLEEYKRRFHKQSITDFGLTLQSVFYSFTSVVLQHISKEETVINDLLWSNYDDGRLIEMDAEIIEQLHPAENAWYTRRILKWLTNQEIISWIAGIMEQGNPCEADKLLQTTKLALPAERWQMISRNFALQRA